MLGFAILRSQKDQVLGMSSLVFGILLIGAGALAYFANAALKPGGWALPPEEKPQSAV
jgi:hypothetical protein